MKCPVEGCDYTGPTKQAILGHCTGKRDEAHKGGWTDWEPKVDGGDTSRAESTETVTETRETGGGSHPKDDVPPREKRKSASSTASTDGGETDLPCGHESYDESEAPDPPYAVSCSECGTTWEVTE